MKMNLIEETFLVITRVLIKWAAAATDCNHRKNLADINLQTTRRQFILDPLAKAHLLAESLRRPRRHQEQQVEVLLAIAAN